MHCGQCRYFFQTLSTGGIGLTISGRPAGVHVELETRGPTASEREGRLLVYIHVFKALRDTRLDSWTRHKTRFEPAKYSGYMLHSWCSDVVSSFLFPLTGRMSVATGSLLTAGWSKSVWTARNINTQKLSAWTTSNCLQ